MEESTIRKLRLETRLHTAAKLFYVYLNDLASETGSVHSTIRELAQETGLSTGSISTAIKQLKTTGYIDADKIKDTQTGGPGSWKIVIQNKPSPIENGRGKKNHK